MKGIWHINLKKKMFVLFGLSLLLAACTANGDSIMTTSSEVHPAMTVTATITEENRVLKTYQNDRFTIEYPGELTFYENERPSVDGVITPLENSIALQGPDFLLTISAFNIAPLTSLREFIDGNVECLEVSSSAGQPATAGNLQGKLYPDTLCGPIGVTYLYAVQGFTGYRFAIESSAAFATLQPGLQTILDSFQAVEAPSYSAEFEQNGISLSYDPAWLGDRIVELMDATGNTWLLDTFTGGLSPGD